MILNLMEVFMKRIAIVLIILTALPFVLFAHGGGHHSEGKNNYPLCSIVNCYEQSVHMHNNEYYCPHYYSDGHKYHELCNVSGCHNIGAHIHNGHHYFSQY
jgi:hypothetical protein